MGLIPALKLHCVPSGSAPHDANLVRTVNLLMVVMSFGSPAQSDKITVLILGPVFLHGMETTSTSLPCMVMVIPTLMAQFQFQSLAHMATEIQIQSLATPIEKLSWTLWPR